MNPGIGGPVPILSADVTRSSSPAPACSQPVLTDACDTTSLSPCVLRLDLNSILFSPRPRRKWVPRGSRASAPTERSWSTASPKRRSAASARRARRWRSCSPGETHASEHLQRRFGDRASGPGSMRLRDRDGGSSASGSCWYDRRGGEQRARPPGLTQHVAVGEQVLNRLEAADRLPVLSPVVRIRDGHLEASARRAERLGGGREPRPPRTPAGSPMRRRPPTKLSSAPAATPSSSTVHAELAGSSACSGVHRDSARARSTRNRAGSPVDDRDDGEHAPQLIHDGRPALCRPADTTPSPAAVACARTCSGFPAPRLVEHRESPPANPPVSRTSSHFDRARAIAGAEQDPRGHDRVEDQRRRRVAGRARTQARTDPAHRSRRRPPRRLHTSRGRAALPRGLHGIARAVEETSAPATVVRERRADLARRRAAGPVTSVRLEIHDQPLGKSQRARCDDVALDLDAAAVDRCGTPVQIGVLELRDEPHAVPCIRGRRMRPEHVEARLAELLLGLRKPDLVHGALEPGPATSIPPDPCCGSSGGGEPRARCWLRARDPRNARLFDRRTGRRASRSARARSADRAEPAASPGGPRPAGPRSCVSVCIAIDQPSLTSPITFPAGTRQRRRRRTSANSASPVICLSGRTLDAG